MEWLQLSLVAPAAEAARFEEALGVAGALSVTLGDSHDVPILEPGVGEKMRDEAIELLRECF